MHTTVLQRVWGQGYPSAIKSHEMGFIDINRSLIMVSDPRVQMYMYLCACPAHEQNYNDLNSLCPPWELHVGSDTAVTRHVLTQSGSYQSFIQFSHPPT